MWIEDVMIKSFYGDASTIGDRENRMIKQSANSIKQELLKRIGEKKEIPTEPVYCNQTTIDYEYEQGFNEMYDKVVNILSE